MFSSQILSLYLTSSLSPAVFQDLCLLFAPSVDRPETFNGSHMFLEEKALTKDLTRAQTQEH